MVTIDTIEKAAERLHEKIHKTPIITSTSINNIAGCNVFFKSEHLQKTGSFKARGAMNAVQIVKEEGKAKGVVTHSSGNHGQALAWAAREIGIPCCVAVPHNAPKEKMEAMRSYGAQIELCGTTIADRESTCERLRKELDYAVVEPFDNQNVMAGQGTIGIEIISQVPDMDAIFIAVGGGGFAGGIATYVGQKRPDVKIFLVEPSGKELSSYLHHGVEPEKDTVNTIADGIRVLRVGHFCYPALQKYCMKEIITINDDDIRSTLKLIWTRTKQRVEPTAAVALAGLLKVSPRELGIRNAVVILCGGNVDVDFIP